jgi:hypothetical protein
VLRRRGTAALLLLLPLTACSEVAETAGRAGDCAGLVRDVASAGLSGTPSAADAEAAARRLEDSVQDIGDATLRESASALRDRVQALAEAARSADPPRAAAAAEDARAAARETAELCGVPVDQLLGG